MQGLHLKSLLTLQKKKHSIYRAGAYQSAEITNDMASLDDSQRSTKLCAQQTAATRQSLE